MLRLINFILFSYCNYAHNPCFFKTVTSSFLHSFSTLSISKFLLDILVNFQSSSLNILLHSLVYHLDQIFPYIILINPMYFLVYCLHIIQFSLPFIFLTDGNEIVHTFPSTSFIILTCCTSFSVWLLCLASQYKSFLISIVSNFSYSTFP